jgi:hypothetical protein
MEKQYQLCNMLTTYVCALFSVQGGVLDWLWFESGSVCYSCQFKDGVSVVGLLLSNQYVLLMKCLYV